MTTLLIRALTTLSCFVTNLNFNSPVAGATNCTLLSYHAASNWCN